MAAVTRFVKILLTTGLGGAALMAGCKGEGEARVTLQQAPCQEVATADINDAAGVDAVFNCANSDGQLDWLRPLVTAMVEVESEDGAPLIDTLLGSTTLASPQASVNPQALADDLDRLAGAIENGVTEAGFIGLAQNIEVGLAESYIRLANLFGKTMADADPQVRRQFEHALVEVMCHGDLDTCESPLRRYLRGVASERVAHDPGDADFAFPSDESVRRRAEWMLYADGDVERARAANEGLARALVRSAQPRPHEPGGKSLLSEIATELLPALHGDDPSTPEVYEGYGSRNPRESALFGFMSAVSRPEVRQSVVDAKAESIRLITEYFQMDNGTVGGTTQMAGACSLDDAVPSVHGLGQLLRMLNAAAYDYDDPSLPLQCGFVFELGMPFLSAYYDFSGSKNLAVITLEMFSQMPVEQAQSGVNLLNHAWAVAAVKAMCGLDIELDDTEATQAIVHMPHNMGYGQPYLRSFANAGMLEQTLQTLTGVWRSGVWCDATETVRLFDDPASFSMPVRQIDPLLPQEGGGPYAHNVITVPRMNMLVDIGRQGEALFGPIEGMLTQPETADVLADLFTGYGEMAHREDSALQYTHLIAEEDAKADPNATIVVKIAEAVSDAELMDALWLTLADDAVRDALLEPGPTGLSFLEELHARVSRETVSDDLKALAKAIRALHDQI